MWTVARGATRSVRPKTAAREDSRPASRPASGHRSPDEAWLSVSIGQSATSLDGAAIRIESATADDLVEGDGLLLLPMGPELDADAVRELRLAGQR